jgi:hypothetical protein
MWTLLFLNTYYQDNAQSKHKINTHKKTFKLVIIYNYFHVKILLHKTVQNSRNLNVLPYVCCDQGKN